MIRRLNHLRFAAVDRLLAVPIRLKIAGIVLLPVIILGLAINFWVRAALSDWLSWLLDSAQVDAAMHAGGRSVLLVTTLAVALSLLLSSALMLILTKPIHELRRTADRVRAGELERRAPVRGRDEIGQVAESFNRMVDELLRIQHALERSNRRLGALCHVAASVGGGLELPNVLDSALQSTLDVAGLECGWIHLRDPDSRGFYLASVVRPPDCLAGPSGDPSTLCDCQLALMEADEWGRPALRECQRQSAERQVHHLSIPLKARGMKLGVLNMLWSKSSLPNEDELDMLEALGVQVSEAVANARLHADLRDKESGMETLLHALSTAQEDERSLIAAELHDGAGQELTSVLLRLKALEARQDPVEIRAGIEQLCVDLSGAIESIRTLSHRIRPPDLDQLGLGPTLRNLMVDMLDQTGVEYSFVSDLDGQRLDPAVEITLYRIAQEAITNITRHANARRASLALRLHENQLLMEIEDDGAGFDPDRLTRSGGTHIGLASIQERVERMGGSFVVRTAPGHGTQLCIGLSRSEVHA